MSPRSIKMKINCLPWLAPQCGLCVCVCEYVFTLNHISIALNTEFRYGYLFRFLLLLLYFLFFTLIFAPSFRLRCDMFACVYYCVFPNPLGLTTRLLRNIHIEMLAMWPPVLKMSHTKNDVKYLYTNKYTHARTHLNVRPTKWWTEWSIWNKSLNNMCVCVKIKYSPWCKTKWKSFRHSRKHSSEFQIWPCN